MSDPAAEVLVFRFDGAATSLEGQLIGALERAESGGALRIAEVLAVARDADSGALVATRLRGRGAGGLVAALADFRMDPQRRRVASDSALTGADPADRALAELAASLAPGSALAAVLVEHLWRAALGDAVRRSGGRAVGAAVVASDAVLAREALALVSRDPLAPFAPDA